MASSWSSTTTAGNDRETRSDASSDVPRCDEHEWGGASACGRDAISDNFVASRHQAEGCDRRGAGGSRNDARGGAYTDLFDLREGESGQSRGGDGHVRPDRSRTGSGFPYLVIRYTARRSRGRRAVFLPEETRLADPVFERGAIFLLTQGSASRQSALTMRRDWPGGVVDCCGERGGRVVARRATERWR